MIRPFDLRDVTLVAQLENQGTALNAELALTRKPRPLQSALASLFILNTRSTRCYVCRGQSEGVAEKLDGLVQMRPRPGSPRGYITFVAPELSVGDSVAALWERMLEYVGVEAARMGLHHLIAEAPEDGREIEPLRHVGFAVYLRRDILHLDPWCRPPSAEGLLRVRQDVDTWAIQQLYFNTAPRLAHFAEGVPLDSRSDTCGYVYEEKGQLAAYVEVRRGPHGAWINLLIHPDAEARAARIMSAALAELGSGWDKPIYCGVRRYQEWLRRPLETMGFEPFASSVLMVKHLVAHVVAPEVALAHPNPLEARAKVTHS
ncbi:MAG TPA: hypothetical protein VIK33_10900 [Anaerolineae bacterium]